MSPRAKALPLYAQLAPALEFLVEEGVLGGFEMSHDKLFWVRPRPPQRKPDAHPAGKSFGSWQALAWELSRILGGQLHPGENGVTWTCGPHAIWMSHPSKEDDIIRARGVAFGLTGEEDLPCSVAGCARRILKWLDIKEPQKSSGDHLLRGIKHHYQSCTPTSSPRASLYDVKACHATLLARMPSPLVNFYGEGQVAFRRLLRRDRERWQEATKAMYEHKGLRNSFIGNMMGRAPGKTGSHYYHNGDPYEGKSGPGMLRPAGLLIIRTAYELCAEVVQESRAMYSNQDCVITEDGLCDTNAWSRAGLRVELRAHGESEVCSVGVYRVGEKQTKWYEAGSRTQTPSRAVSVQGYHFGRWLDQTRMAA